MKRISLLLLSLNIFVSATYADFILSHNCERLTENGMEIFVFANMTAAEIKYQDSQVRDFIWKRNGSADTIKIESGLTTSLTEPELEANMGYTLEVKGKITYEIYVLNYERYIPKIKSVVARDGENLCDDPTKVEINFLDVPLMEYYTPMGTGYAISRDFSLTYDILTWNEQSLRFDTEVVTPPRLISIYSTPLEPYELDIDDIFVNTRFILSGDQFAKKFGMEVITRSEEYIAVKPIVRATGTLNERTALNEKDRKNKGDKRKIEASAPLEVTLEVFQNELESSSRYYRWNFYNILNGETGGPWHEPKFQITFSDFGEYVVRVEATTNLGCVASDSIEVIVPETILEVPNVFTPNGDGINDEFRVAYRSITKFNMWVYNRWGRLVFSSNSPDKGWDGYIGSAKAATGAYFYVIEYTTVKGERKRTSGDINLLR